MCQAPTSRTAESAYSAISNFAPSVTLQPEAALIEAGAIRDYTPGDHLLGAPALRTAGRKCHARRSPKVFGKFPARSK